MLEDSVTHRVLEATPVPVEVIAGDAVSRWERWGLPAGVLGVGGLLLAIDPVRHRRSLRPRRRRRLAAAYDAW